MANETIGHVRCPLGDGCTGEVRQYKTGKRKYYWVCDHGMITPNLQAGQDYITANMVPLSQEAPDQPAAAPQAPKPQQQPKPKAKGWFSALLEDDDE